MKARLFTDGGSRGNPGPSAFAYVLVDEDKKIITSGKQMIGVTTNNVAEYSGLMVGLDEALRFGVTHLEVMAHSELMIKQMQGVYKVKNRDLRKLHKECQRLARRFVWVKFNTVRREDNKDADKLVNDSLEGF